MVIEYRKEPEQRPPLHAGHLGEVHLLGVATGPPVSGLDFSYHFPLGPFFRFDGCALFWDNMRESEGGQPLTAGNKGCQLTEIKKFYGQSTGPVCPVAMG
jgi:hypothetical protein